MKAYLLLAIQWWYIFWYYCDFPIVIWFAIEQHTCTMWKHLKMFILYNVYYIILRAYFYTLTNRLSFQLSNIIFLTVKVKLITILSKKYWMLCTCFNLCQMCYFQYVANIFFYYDFFYRFFFIYILVMNFF